MTQRYYLTELDSTGLGSWHNSIPEATREAVRLIGESEAPLWFGIVGHLYPEHSVARADHPEASNAAQIVAAPA